MSSRQLLALGEWMFKSQTPRRAHFDYPGVMRVENLETARLEWTIGTANVDWGADLETLDGHVMDSFTLDGSQHWPLDRVAEALLLEFATREAVGHS